MICLFQLIVHSFNCSSRMQTNQPHFLLYSFVYFPHSRLLTLSTSPCVFGIVMAIRIDAYEFGVIRVIFAAV